MKKLLAIFMTLVILATTVLSAVPVGAENADASVETGNNDLTVEGTNGFGNLLSEDLLESQEETEEYKEGYTVTDLVIEGNTAIVTYDSLERANLVVALYTEDMVQMITSANTVADPESTEARVTFEGEMPEYFMAAAYLMDVYDMSPLCPTYDTPLYTKDMQDLLNSTVNDYDEEKILNLDESEETNFAVYGDDTIVIEGDENTNTVASIDDESLTYVIENADSTVKNLSVGSVFVYPYGESEILIAKVGEITVDGDTVTVTGTDLEMEDAFSHVKIEGESYTPDMTVDTSTADEGVTYNGLVSNGNTSRAWEDGSSKEYSHSFDFKHESKTNNDNVSTSVTITGSLKLNLVVSVNYYISLKKQYIEFKASPTVTAEIHINGKIDASVPLGKFGVVPVAGVFVGFEPSLEMKFDGKFDATITVSNTFGVGYYSDTGVKNLTTKPVITHDLNLEINIYFGIDFKPQITVLEWIAKAEFTTKVGVELHAKGIGSLFDDETDNSADTRHACMGCIKMDLTFKAEISGSINFLGIEKLTIPINIGNWSVPLGNMYWSMDMGILDWGSCPNVEYKTTIAVYDYQKTAAPEITVSLSDGQSAVTNENGIAAFYLKNGSYTAEAVIGDNSVQKSFSVSNNSQKVAIYDEKMLNLPSESDLNTSNKIQIESSDDNGNSDLYVDVDYGTVIKSGTCGANAYWDLYDSGTLVISGSGEMDDYYPFLNDFFPPWYYSRNRINRVVINDGITNIGEYAFNNCASLTSIDLSGCTALTSIGRSAFGFCDSLTSINLSNHTSLTSIGGYAFDNCASLMSADLSGCISLASIGAYAFRSCASLTSVDLSDCTSLTSIGEATFYNCNRLASIIIPASVTCIGEYAFYSCDSLTSITIPDSVTTIGRSAFEYCDSLMNVTIPDSVTNIGRMAFRYCTSLTTVYYGGSKDDWNNISISSYNEDLLDANIVYNCSSAVASCSLDDDITIMSADVNDGISVMSVYPGEYGSEETENYTLKTASFEDLAPEKDYVLLVLVDMGAEDTLCAENLLYIAQGTALDDGTLTFKYVPRYDADASYVIACGPSNKDLSDAEITFPEMEADGESAAVEPVVVYDGVTLTEGVDYVIVGTVDYSRGGTYTCYIRGIYDYTGVVTCTYTVTGTFIPGDIDGDSRLTAMDSNLLKRMVAGASSAEGIVAADVNGDGSVNAIDSNILRRTIAGQ